MANLNCYAARGINIIIGIFFISMAILLFISGFSFLPIIGFFLAFAVVCISFLFMVAPRDRICFIPLKTPNSRRKQM